MGERSDGCFCKRGGYYIMASETRRITISVDEAGCLSSASSSRSNLGKPNKRLLKKCTHEYARRGVCQKCGKEGV